MFACSAGQLTAAAVALSDVAITLHMYGVHIIFYSE